jgi:hypothetical protein
MNEGLFSLPALPPFQVSFLLATPSPAEHFAGNRRQDDDWSEQR